MSNCIFCRIIAGEIPSATVYEDNDFKAIMDIAPAARGHVIILTKKHFSNLFELEPDTASKVLTVAGRIAAAVKAELGCDGINLLQNNGEAAGQSVFHYHMHVIPRYNGDEVTIPWKQLSYGEGEAAVLARKIAVKLS